MRRMEFGSRLVPFRRQIHPRRKRLRRGSAGVRVDQLAVRDEHPVIIRPRLLQHLQSLPLGSRLQPGVQISLPVAYPCHDHSVPLSGDIHYVPNDDNSVNSGVVEQCRNRPALSWLTLVLLICVNAEYCIESGVPPNACQVVYAFGFGVDTLRVTTGKPTTSNAVSPPPHIHERRPRGLLM